MSADFQMPQFNLVERTSARMNPPPHCISLRVPGSLSEHDGALRDVDAELVVKRVPPDGLHGLPVCDDAVGDGVGQREDASLGLEEKRGAMEQICMAVRAV